MSRLMVLYDPVPERMDVNIADILKVIGPAASIVFAAWIFMGFLQQRYDAAIERYFGIIEHYRTEGSSETRRSNIRDEILVYKRRCEIMNYANVIGIVSAILLILTLILGELDMIFPGASAFKYASAVAALVGFTCVIVAAALVLVESFIIRRQINSELLDIPELAELTGQSPGAVADPERS